MMSKGLSRLLPVGVVLILIAGGSAAVSGEASLSGFPAGSGGLAAESSRPADGHAWVIFGQDTVVAEVAANADERAQGAVTLRDLDTGEQVLIPLPELTDRLTAYR